VFIESSLTSGFAAGAGGAGGQDVLLTPKTVRRHFGRLRAARFGARSGCRIRREDAQAWARLPCGEVEGPGAVELCGLSGAQRVGVVE
jgi:hypothetical protein